MSEFIIPGIMIVLALGIALVVFYLFYLKKVEHEPVPGQFFSSAQGPIFYETLGKSGPYLLFIHGLGASTYCWRKIRAAYSKEYRLITFDLWGFGLSGKKLGTPMDLDTQVEIINALVDHLGIKKLNVVGHSMGAEIGFWYCIRYPDKVDKIVAIAPAGHPDLVSNQLRRIHWVARFTPMLINRGSIKRLLYRLLYDPAFVTEEMIDKYFEPYRDPLSHISFASALNLLRDVRVFNQLPTIKNKVLILWGDKDKVVPLRFIKDIHKQLGNSVLKTTPNSGHLIIEDDPNWVIEHMTPFLKSSGSSRWT